MEKWCATILVESFPFFSLGCFYTCLIWGGFVVSPHEQSPDAGCFKMCLRCRQCHPWLPWHYLRGIMRRKRRSTVGYLVWYQCWEWGRALAERWTPWTFHTEDYKLRRNFLYIYSKLIYINSIRDILYIYLCTLYIIYILVWTANLSPREFYCFFASQLFFSEDFSDFEDTRPEMNNLGFLKADGQHLGFAPVTDGGWYVGSAEHCIFLWCWYGYLMIIWMMMFYMQYVYI